MLLGYLAVHAFSQSADWSCWRGPNHDGVSTETGWNPEALKGGAKVRGTADIGAGYSSIAVSQGWKTLAFAFTCLDARN